MLKYALDIGSYSTRLLNLEGQKSTFEVKGAVSLPTEGYFGGIITDGKKLLFTILEVLNEFEKKYSKKPKKIFINCSNPKIKFYHLRESFLREDSERPITSRELENYKQRVLRDSLPLEEKEIYLEVAGYRLDEQRGVINPYRMLAKNLEVNLNVVTIPLTVYSSIYSLISETGIEIEGMVPEIIAKATALLPLEEIRAGIMLIDIGWGITKIALFKNGTLKATKVFECDLKSIFELFQSIYHLDFREAEEILEESFLTESPRLRIGSTSLKEISPENVRNIIYKRLRKILYLIRRYIEREKFYYYLGEGVAITGGKILDFPDLPALASEILRQPVKSVKPDTSLCGEEYVTAFGILKYAFMKEQNIFEDRRALGLIRKISAPLFRLIERYF